MLRSGLVHYQFKDLKDIVFSADGERLAGFDDDFSVKILETRHCTLVQTISLDSKLFGGVTHGSSQVYPHGVMAFLPNGTLRLALQKRSDRTVAVFEGSPKNELFSVRATDASIGQFSAGGKFLALMVNELSPGTRSHTGFATVMVIDGATGKEHLSIRGKSMPQSFSPDGKYMVTVDFADRDNGKAKVWNISTGEEVNALSLHFEGTRQPQMVVALGTDGKQMACPGNNNSVALCDFRAKRTTTLTGHTQPIHNLAFSPDGKWLASAAHDNTVRIWSATNGQQATVYKMPRTSSLVFSPDSRRLLARGEKAWMWNLSEFQTVFNVQGASGDFSPDGRLFALVSPDGRVRVWDVRSRKERFSTLLVSNDAFVKVAFSPDGKTLAALSRLGKLRRWNPETAAEQPTLEGEHVLKEWTPGWHAVLGVTRNNLLAFSPDSKKVAALAGNDAIRIWDASSGREVLQLSHRIDTQLAANSVGEGRGPDSAEIIHMGFSQDGKRFFSLARTAAATVNTSGDNKAPSSDRFLEVKIWKAANGLEISSEKGKWGKYRSDNNLEVTLPDDIIDGVALCSCQWHHVGKA